MSKWMNESRTSETSLLLLIYTQDLVEEAWLENNAENIILLEWKSRKT